MLIDNLYAKEAWRNRPLDGVVLDYLFLDASMFRMHPGARAEPVLAAWGIDTAGKPVFVALAAGGSESTDAWGDFLDELAGRGLRPSLLVISDGAAGLINAAESALARSLRQRCLIHRARNVLAKVPATAQQEIRGAYWEIFDTAALTGAGMKPGQRLVSTVQARIDAFAEKYCKFYPAAVRCLLSDCEQLPAVPRRASQADPALQLHRAHVRGDPPPGQGHRPVPRRGQLPQPRLGRPGPGLPRLARPDHHQQRHPPAPGPPPPAPRPAHPTPTPAGRRERVTGKCRSRRLTSIKKEPSRRYLHRLWDATFMWSLENDPGKGKTGWQAHFSSSASSSQYWPRMDGTEPNAPAKCSASGISVFIAG